MPLFHTSLFASQADHEWPSLCCAAKAGTNTFRISRIWYELIFGSPTLSVQGQLSSAGDINFVLVAPRLMMALILVFNRAITRLFLELFPDWFHFHSRSFACAVGFWHYASPHRGCFVCCADIIRSAFAHVEVRFSLITFNVIAAH
jgi:hypothetical protein